MQKSSNRIRTRERQRSRSVSPPIRHNRRARSTDRREHGRSEKKKSDAMKEEIQTIKIKEEPKEDKFELSEKETEQNRLDLEMQKRRERIEKWRAERREKDREDEPEQITILPAKKWTLDDDNDEEMPIELIINNDSDNNDNMEVHALNPQQEVDEVDPLDAFMQGMQEEVRRINKLDMQKMGRQEAQAILRGKVTMMSGIAKKREDKKKGELIEQDQDALEYSSEEENEDLQSAMSGLQSKQKKKMLQVVNHNEITYQPFRKDFYIEVPELVKMTKDEVEAYRADLEGIRIRGKGCPKPIKSWPHCGLSKKVHDILKKQNYEKPTPIQTQAIPVIMSGRDMIGIAKTGSGKTLAFLLPMFRHILDQPPLEDDDGPISIIMTPTRELAMQIAKECRKFTKFINLHVVCVYGGTGISEQIAELKRGAEIIVCTPGRMIDMLAANNGRVTNLRRCTFVVLDEADRMFDMGFEPQVMRIIDNVRPDRQTVMFSATFPRAMEALARRVLSKPIEVQVGGRSVVCKEVEQNVMVIDEDQKFFKLLELLGFYQDSGSILIFVDTQDNADTLMKDLMMASYPCMSLHGGIDQVDRDGVMLDFKAGKVKLLVATSVAARGLDVKQLNLVVNYDCPNHYEDYVHRCGRTGRAGNKGYAYTFITSEQSRYTLDIIKALKLSNNSVPDDVQKLWDNYEAKQKAEGKKAKGGSGFSGRGFKFDEAEAQLINDRKKYEKAAAGFKDSDDENEDTENDLDQQIEDMLASKRSVKESIVSINNSVVVSSELNIGANVDKLELAKRLANRISNVKNSAVSQAEAIMKGAVVQSVISAKSVAEQLVEKLNARLNYQPKLVEDAQVETLKRIQEELEINDLPQQARWRVTSKEALARIGEYSEAGISVRGTYFANEKDVKDGERKLHLVIESVNELAVSKAKTEITRIIKEELLKLQNSGHPINRGRYKVL
uniref:Probable ATP-dependent RNA helicase DDX46 n=1 Tax=Strigamia maritima TaxID=126957 RepID=T1IN03_STRMM